MVTVVAIFIGYHANWAGEREKLLKEWEAAGGRFLLGDPPMGLRVLGARGVSRFQYGFFEVPEPGEPVMIAVDSSTREKIAKLFPESDAPEALDCW